MNQVFQDALKATFDFIGNSVQFTLGLLGVILYQCLLLQGEIIDELTTYKNEGPFPWMHIVKVFGPAISGAVLAYMTHRGIVARALNSVPPAQRASATGPIEIPKGE